MLHIRQILKVPTIYSLLAACSTPGPIVSTEPAGETKTAKTKVLEIGADLIQDTAPVKQLTIYLAGYHLMKKDPSHQMEAHHYCQQVNEDLAQCVLYDGNTQNANLVGIEYIISEKIFESLQPGERPNWHPHNYEILSGQLIAPGLPANAEKQLMQQKMNSYGKTWHIWNSKSFGVPKGDSLPLGQPMLMWSFNADGETLPGLLEEREQKFGTNTEAIRASRAELRALAHPQEGVDALQNKFRAQRSKPPGVEPKAGKSR